MRVSGVVVEEAAVCKLLSAAVLEAAKFNAGLVQRANHRTPSGKSTLGRAFERAGTLEARSHLVDAVLQAEYTVLSAADHARAFAALVRGGQRRPSTSLLTLCRGALEALARARWLIQDLDFETIAHRSISLLYGDLRYPEVHGEVLLSRDGADVDPRERRHFYLSELERLGLGRPLKIEITSLVDALVSLDVAHQADAHLYSLLSSVAHGHRASINAFIRTSDEKKVLGLSASLPVVTEVALQLVVTQLETAKAMAAWYGDPEDEVARLDGARERIGMRLTGLPDSAFGDN